MIPFDDGPDGVADGRPRVLVRLLDGAWRRGLPLVLAAALAACGGASDPGPASSRAGAPSDRPSSVSPYERDATPPNRKYPGPCLWFWDLDRDGEDEATSLGVYDDQDRLVLVRTDWSKSGPDWKPGEPIPGPGQPKEHFRYTYDERGRRLTEQWVSHGDDHPSEIMTIEYDVQGRRVRGKVDENSDGTVEGSVVFTNDEAGRVAAEVWDVDGDGTIDQRVRHRYDAHGNRTHSWYSATGPYDEEHVDYHFACWDRGGPTRVDSMPPPMPEFTPEEGPPR